MDEQGILEENAALEAKNVALMQAYDTMKDTAMRLKTALEYTLDAHNLPRKTHAHVFIHYDKALEKCEKLIKTI